MTKTLMALLWIIIDLVGVHIGKVLEMSFSCTNYWCNFKPSKDIVSKNLICIRLEQLWRRLIHVTDPT